MSWIQIRTATADLVARHNPRPSDRAYVEAMIAEAEVKDPAGLGAVFLSQAIT